MQLYIRSACDPGKPDFCRSLSRKDPGRQYRLPAVYKDLHTGLIGADLHLFQPVKTNLPDLLCIPDPAPAGKDQFLFFRNISKGGFFVLKTA